MKPECYNYRTLRPEKGGLYSEEVFGEVDWDDKLGYLGDARSQRWGHITLCIPIQVREGPVRVVAVMPPIFRRFFARTAEHTRIEARRRRDDLMQSENPGGDPPWQVLGEEGLWKFDEARPLSDEEIELLSGTQVEPEVNSLYRAVIIANGSLRRMHELDAPERALHPARERLSQYVRRLLLHIEGLELPAEVRRRSLALPED